MSEPARAIEVLRAAAIIQRATDKMVAAGRDTYADGRDAVPDDEAVELVRGWEAAQDNFHRAVMDWHD